MYRNPHPGVGFQPPNPELEALLASKPCLYQTVDEGFQAFIKEFPSVLMDVLKQEEEEGTDEENE